MRFVIGLLCAGAALTIGCGGSDTKNQPAEIPVSDVKGSIVDVHVTELGDVLHTRGPSNFEIAALVPDASGTPREIIAAIADDGTFVIPDVPEGPYDLRFTEYVASGTLSPRYIVNAPRQIDLGRVYLGRPDATAITTSPSELTLTATGLEPWTSGDSLELFSLNSGAAGELLPTNGTFPVDAATALTNYRVDTAQLSMPVLVEGNKGDKAIITQLSATTGTTAAYRSVRKTFELPDFTQQNGVNSKLSGAFADVAQKNLTVNIDTNAFKSYTKTVHPDATLAGKNVYVIAEPGGQRTTTSIPPNLLICEALPSSSLPAKFSYGNPFPSTWAEVVSADVSYSVTHVAPTGVPKSTIVTIGQTGPVDSFTSPTTPLLSPPLDIQINGMPGQDALSGIGFTPTITFTPPAIGTPAVYIIAVRKLDPGGAATRTTAVFSTTDTKLQIPPGLLAFGYYYYFRISVRSVFDINQPFKSDTTNAYASALTGVLTP